MKKLYTLALAAAVAVSASAAPRYAIDKTFQSDGQLAIAKTIGKTEQFVKANNTSTRAKAATNAPKSLDGMQFICTFELTGQSSSNEFSIIEFNYESTTESGFDVYTMTGLADGFFNNVSILPQIVGYDSTSGTLILPVAQDFAVYNNKTYVTWNKNADDGYLYADVDFYFSWNGNGFEWAKTVTLPTDSGELDFTSKGMTIGIEVQDGISWIFALGNFDIIPLNGTMAATITSEEGDNNVNIPVSAAVDGNQVTFRNFLGYTIPCTLDDKAKTLTAKDVTLGSVNVSQDPNTPELLPVYVSAAQNDYNTLDSFNANDDGVYELVMTYTTGNGKTEITVPDWNIFVMIDGADWPNYYPIHKTSITLDFELSATTEGVEGITIDDSNAPVEYFNLQGVRVANPENGLYIRRQGNKAQKVLVK